MSEKNTNKKKQKARKALRLIILIIFLLFSTAIGLLHQYGKNWIPVGVDALCPFGGIESAYALITSGEMLPRIALSSFILLGAIVIIAVIFRRSFCGNVCALGTLQELFGRLGRLIFKKRPVMPSGIDKPLRYLKYLVLLAIVVFSAIYATLIIRPFDPWAAYHHLLSPELFSEFLVGFFILAASLLLSVVFDRFFCKYLCPMGGFLGIISKIGLFKVKRNKGTCIDCMACNKACPVNIPVQSLEKVTTAECIQCMECINSCPVKNTLYNEGPSKKRISPTLLIGISVLIFAAVVGSTTLTGTFKWGEVSIEEGLKKTGELDPDTITGRNTFRQVSELSGIPKEAFIERFGLSGDEFDAPIRESAHKEGSTFDTDDVKEFVREKMQR